MQKHYIHFTLNCIISLISILCKSILYDAYAYETHMPASYSSPITSDVNKSLCIYIRGKPFVLHVESSFASRTCTRAHMTNISCSESQNSGYTPISLIIHKLNPALTTLKNFFFLHIHTQCCASVFKHFLKHLN